MNSASTAATTIDHPNARAGAHDIMDGSSAHGTPYQTAVWGTVWPGMILDDDYIVTECYEEYDSDGTPTFRWFCKPINA